MKSPATTDLQLVKSDSLRKVMGAPRPLRRCCCCRPALFFVGLLVFVGLMCVYNRLDIPILNGYGLHFDSVFVKVFNNEDYSLNTYGCLIRKLDPFDRRMSRYFKKLRPYKCPQNAADVLIYLEKGVLRVFSKARSDIIKARPHDAQDKAVDFTCRKWKVWREHVEANDDAFRVSEKYTEFEDFLEIDDEYVKVMCYLNGQKVYHNYFYNVVKKPEVESQCLTNEKEFLQRHPSCTDRLSVLVMGIDSVSKANFIRQFPKTHDLIVNNYSALDFDGYAKVGLNTFPCLMPYLTGLSSDEVQSHCWGGGMHKFDACTTLWDKYEEAGYRTAFVENLDNFGLFTYNKGGFNRQPVHYYGRTLYLPVMKNVKQFLDGCWRGYSDDELLIWWMQMFQEVFRNDPHFGHFWMSRLTHDDINTAQHDDPALSEVLRNMARAQVFNNTLLILMSDHGVRFGAFRETEMGRYEENLPFMYMAFPEWFKRKYPLAMQRLQTNTHRLITTFDLHATLESILYCDYKMDAFMKVTHEFRDRGISLFQNISPNRTCDDAGIPAIYCPCSETVQHLDVNSSESNMGATLLVQELNRLTSKVRDICVKYQLKSIISVKKVKNDRNDNGGNATVLSVENSLVVAILTQPGDAKFEATIQRTTADNQYFVNRDIRRINRYGKTSACIKNDGLLKSICYCKV